MRQVFILPTQEKTIVFFALILCITGFSFATGEEIQISSNSDELQTITYMNGDKYSSFVFNESISEDMIQSFVDYTYFQNSNGEFAGAAILSDQILEIDPENWAALSMKGWALMGLNRTQEGLTFIEKSLKVFPDNPLALSNKASALYILGRGDEALETLEYAEILDPKNRHNDKIRDLLKNNYENEV